MRQRVWAITCLPPAATAVRLATISTPGPSRPRRYVTRTKTPSSATPRVSPVSTTCDSIRIGLPDVGPESAPGGIRYTSIGKRVKSRRPGASIDPAAGAPGARMSTTRSVGSAEPGGSVVREAIGNRRRPRHPDRGGGQSEPGRARGWKQGSQLRTPREPAAPLAPSGLHDGASRQLQSSMPRSQAERLGVKSGDRLGGPAGRPSDADSVSLPVGRS